MIVFGREQWLRGGEAFSIVFALFARFAPTEVRVVGPTVCAACSAAECRQRTGDCVGCYECFDKAKDNERHYNLRPYAVGLLPNAPVHTSMMVFVLVVLATVTFDGLKETGLKRTVIDTFFYLPGARWFLPRLARMSGDIEVGILSITMVAFVLAVVAVYLLFAHLMARAGGSWSASPPRTQALSSRQIDESASSSSWLDTARLFVLTLMPIALAYHLAHYLTYFVIYAQSVVPLASDPFGFGWDLVGTANYRIDIGVLDARFAWYTAVIAIVAGHIIAVYLTHFTALRVYGNKRSALRSQYPMVVAMVAYTVLSLWILAQPIVAAA